MAVKRELDVQVHSMEFDEADDVDYSMVAKRLVQLEALDMWDATNCAANTLWAFERLEKPPIQLFAQAD
ncbi:Uu.00g110080.m01.CDS01 [Anthostomella pinea]|uniref:Uu.00g110080.m01.CDS01 n=1 Tax=Anthostomella pinea TaxID=933095 RepID=A0AAI8YG53_9PEZI|nr:Uu.00g110080.m01.CDS01 [Anthostomella pinea]